MPPIPAKPAVRGYPGSPVTVQPDVNRTIEEKPNVGANPPGIDSDPNERPVDPPVVVEEEI